MLPPRQIPMLTNISDKVNTLFTNILEGQYPIGNIYMDVDAIPALTPMPTLSSLMGNGGDLDQITRENTRCNYQKPSKRIWRGAVLGNMEDQYQVGEWYRLGNMVPKDISTARDWYEKAKSKGHLLARFKLATLS